MTFEGEGCPPVVNGHRSRMRRIAKIAIPTTAALGAGAFVASAAIPSADGTINACYNTATGANGQPGALRVIDSGQSCGEAEKPLSWNQKGPAGPQGSQGPAGANGLNGQNGASGAGGGSPSVFPRGATSYLLEIDGIKGESTDQKHPGSIQVDSFSFGENQTGAHGAGGGGGAGKVRFHDISFTAPVDAASPKLFQACATGQHIKKATLYVRKAGGQQVEYLTISLTDVLVSSYHVGSQEPKGPGEVASFSLNFAKIQQAYTPTKADGSPGAAIQAGYDVKANKKA